MVEDVIVRIGASMLQHGPLSQRVYLMHLDPEDSERIVGVMEALARENGYSKLFAKVPSSTAAVFAAAGFIVEAQIPDFYSNGDAALFFSRFLSETRAIPTDVEHIDRVLETAKARAAEPQTRCLPREYRILPMGHANANRMAELYRAVFETYPFPIHDPDYLARSMDDDNFSFFGVACGGDVVALSSCEKDGSGVEMTDFATDPSLRRTGLGGHLLAAMEKEMRLQEVKTAFTIARAVSFGINILFARAGYEFAGTLINNTNISGRLESMNVWSKPLNGFSGD